MDLRQLRYFAQIADSGNVREAALRLHVAQSALSRHLRALEQELGTALFERHARGVTLTRAGVRLLEHANDILRRIDEARAEIMAEAGSPAGTAAIGTSAAGSRFLYGRLAERIRNQFPGIALSLVEGAPYLLLEGLDTGRLDLAILVNPEPRASLHFDPLITEQVYLIGTQKDRQILDDTGDVADLESLPLVLFPRPSGSRMSFERAAIEAGITLNLVYQVESQDVLKDFIDRGLGLGLLPYSSIHREVDEGRFIAVEIDGLRLTRTLVRRADRPPTLAVETLARLVREEMNALNGAGVMKGAVP